MLYPKPYLREKILFSFLQSECPNLCHYVPYYTSDIWENPHPYPPHPQTKRRNNYQCTKFSNYLKKSSLRYVLINLPVFNGSTLQHLVIFPLKSALMEFEGPVVRKKFKPSNNLEIRTGTAPPWFLCVSV